MRNLLFVCAAVAGLAVAAPPLLTAKLERPEGGGDSAAARPARERSPASAARGGRELRFRAGRNGHFVLDAAINGRAVPVMVDTGASIVALRESDAEAAGIRVHRADFTLELSTANGIAYAVPIEIDRIDVGGIEVDRVAGVVVPDERLGISLLGTSFLSRLRRFEVAGDTLVFED